MSVMALHAPGDADGGGKGCEKTRGGEGRGHGFYGRAPDERMP